MSRRTTDTDDLSGGTITDERGHGVERGQGVDGAEPARGEGGPGRRPAIATGLMGGLIAATCCVGPALGVALGLSAGSFLATMGRYRPIAFVIGAAGAAVVLAALLRSRRAACSSRASFVALRSRWIDAAMLTFAVTYAVGRFALPPLIERL